MLNIYIVCNIIIMEAEGRRGEERRREERRGEHRRKGRVSFMH